MIDTGRTFLASFDSNQKYHQSQEIIYSVNAVYAFSVSTSHGGIRSDVLIETDSRGNFPFFHHPFSLGLCFPSLQRRFQPRYLSLGDHSKQKLISCILGWHQSSGDEKEAQLHQQAEIIECISAHLPWDGGGRAGTTLLAIRCWFVQILVSLEWVGRREKSLENILIATAFMNAFYHLIID